MKTSTFLILLSLCMPLLVGMASDNSVQTGKCNKLLTSQEIERSKYNNFTNIRDGDDRSVNSKAISSEFFSPGSAKVSVGPHGERVSILAYTNSDSTKLLAIASDTAKEITPAVNSKELAIARSSISLSNKEVLKYYIEKKMNKDNRLGDDTLNYLLEVYLKDQNTIKEAYEFMALGLISTPSSKKTMVELSNNGSHSFIWFIPDGSRNYVPARILDIHTILEREFSHKVKTSFQCCGVTKGAKNNHRRFKDHYVFLVEYLQSQSGSHNKTKHIAELSSTEFETITRNKQFTSELASQSFIDELSPLEYSTVHLADKVLNLKLYGYSETKRVDRKYESEYISTPLRMMKNGSSLVTKVEIEKHIGSLESIRLPNDPDNIDVLDLFSRLDPKYVVDNFFHPEFEYIWVIDQNGTLKIAPKMLKGNNFQPQLLRLASGRKIYVGGHFTFINGKDFNIEYGFRDPSRRGDGLNPIDGFRSTPELMEFIHLVFHQQAEAGHIIYNMFFQHTLNTKLLSYAKTPRVSLINNEIESVSWSLNNKELMLDFEHWAQKNRNSNKTIWAYYILQSNSKMKYKDIKKNYRELAKIFHPDKQLANDPQTQPDNRPMRLVQEAYEMLTEHL